ncbi:MAG: hypothetical protein ACYS0H_16695 [Planctomycetota bacterium]|jgi:hypothetical protein
MPDQPPAIIANISFYRVTLELLSQVFLDLPDPALVRSAQNSTI